MQVDEPGGDPEVAQIGALEPLGNFDLVALADGADATVLDENDGVVSVPSQLLPEVQDVAASVLGVYADHMGILASPISLRRLENSLAH